MKAIELEKAYNPKDFEDRLYDKWEKEGYFKPSSDVNSPLYQAYKAGCQAHKTGKVYSVVIPPPNVTGVLHMGHGLNNTLQDIAVRYHRMQGFDTLWLPGTDHAGIATQNVVERRLKKEGLSRQDIGREKFLERTWVIKEEHQNIIVKQQKKLGNSTDWSRQRFTLDAGLSKAVRDVFVTLYERGLIYKGNYLVNWCPCCGTALADDEVEHKDTPGAMYHIFYEFIDGPAADGSTKIEIATTRPETLLGDTAVAVNPLDTRYTHLVGKKLKLPLTNRVIPIIADAYVDKDFGTGMVKITPAHDPNDYEVGKRCNLEIINILNPDGTLNANCPKKYQGLSCKDARDLVIADLKEAGLFKGEEKITHSVGHCYRCGTVVEPYLSEQWFVKMRPLADKALKAWQNGDIVFFPKKWENTYKHWMQNIKDWCISRQLWWGHRIPVWHCKKCGKMIVSRDDPAFCPECQAKKEDLVQESDVLDTWFSSWLWPFSTLGWPEKTADLQKFYPTTALVTAYDIIFFWVSRMVMAGLEFTGKAPFHDIYIHGLVRDKKGRKMSKSLGNGLDPLEIIDEYGADALKFTLGFLCAQGQDVLVDKDTFKLGSRFANKIWNASRYILGNLEGRNLLAISDNDLSEIDRWIYHRLNVAVTNITGALDGYRYNEAAGSLYEFFWNDFCDWYVEATKLSFSQGDAAEKDRAVSVLLNVLEEALRLLHPYLPFVTEEIYSKLPLKEITAKRKEAKDKGSPLCVLPTSLYEGMLIAAPYPQVTPARCNERVAKRFEVIQQLIKNVRNIKAECGIDPQTKISLRVMLEKTGFSDIIKEKIALIRLLLKTGDIDFVTQKIKNAIGTAGAGFEAFVLATHGIDCVALKQKLQKQIEAEKTFADKVQKKLLGPFAQNAPKEVVEEQKQKLKTCLEHIKKLSSYVTSLSGS